MNMKVGDLVELSAVGRNTLYLHGFRGKIGVVVETHSKKERFYPIKVTWVGVGTDNFLRSSLKFVSRV